MDDNPTKPISNLRKSVNQYTYSFPSFNDYQFLAKDEYREAYDRIK